MLTSLDPHSSYLSANDAADMRVQTRGEFGGLGIEVTQEEGFVKVVSPMDGTPADLAGIEAGDFITHVNGESVLGLTLDEAVEMMRGPVGSEIIITVVREGTDRALRRVDHPRHDQADRRADADLEGDTVVLRVTTFNDQTFPNLEAGLQRTGRGARRDGEHQRHRPRPAQQPRRPAEPGDRVSDAFLDAGEIVSTRGRDPQDGERYNARRAIWPRASRWSC
jgi:carboxyl-terminal processing protease